ncbi:MAG: Trm112 family protein [Candidatus Helarchaeota archaeon]
MKPLLLDILACPICKHFPLKLDILKWETSEKTFSTILEAFHKSDNNILKKATKIRRGIDKIDDAVVITRNGRIGIRDELVRIESNLLDYLREAELKFENFSVIEDHSGEKSANCLDLIKEKVITHILEAKAEIEGENITDMSLEKQEALLKKIISEIYLVNWFFQFSEIEDGIIYCENCSRWYPIMETIRLEIRKVRLNF